MSGANYLDGVERGAQDMKRHTGCLEGLEG